MDILSYIVFLPFITAVLVCIFRVNTSVIKLAAMFSALAVLVMALMLVSNFDPNAGMQFVQIKPWIESFGITYHVGVDGISIVLLVVLSVIMPTVYLYMWNNEKQGYWYNMMLLQAAVGGAIVSLNLIQFYLFWELMLIPVFIMIGRYGVDNQQFNAMKIFLFTAFGSLAMLYAIFYLGYSFYAANGFWSFDLYDLAKLQLDSTTATILAGAFLLAFAIKIPLVGFHTWLAPSYGSSPVPAIIIMSGIMAKVGVYGIWRFMYNTMFDKQIDFFAPLVIFLSLAGMIYFAITAIKEDNLKRMFAYASASHISLLTLGVVLANSYAWNGSLFFIGAHALSSVGIFLMIGLIASRTGTVSIKSLGGIATVAPKFTFFFMFFALSIVGLPGTGGFAAELTIIIGAFAYDFWVGVIASMTLIAAITFIFWMLQRAIFGPTAKSVEGFKDLNARELIMVLPFFVLLLLTGIFPSYFMDIFEPLIDTLLSQRGGAL